ncbi:hypothetical protein QL285_021159 [Trifolium repens]|nr:hypothetical protein QL285_021159 [Trifolium repens]
MENRHLLSLDSSQIEFITTLLPSLRMDSLVLLFTSTSTFFFFSSLSFSFYLLLLYSLGNELSLFLILNKTLLNPNKPQRPNYPSF